MNQLKEQIISFTVELEDKEKTYELLKKKLESERNDFASVEDTLTRKYQQLLSVSHCWFHLNQFLIWTFH
jgi:uncharacterized membrane-anchored protein YhcB (DUF1043 family)